MTVFILQLIAMTTMTIDHVGFILLGDLLPMRCIGRIAFPIYAFLIAEGYRHIRTDPARVDKHLGTYIVLTLVSEICYDIMVCNPLTVSRLFDSQSVMITLLAAFMGLMATDRWRDRPVFMWAALLLAVLVSYLTAANYRFTGVLLIYAFYIYVNRMEWMNYLQRLVCLMAIITLYILVYHWSRNGFCTPAEYLAALSGNTLWWYRAHAVLPFILAAYTGRKGYYSKKFKMVYKYYYPAHMLAVGILARILL